MIRPGSALDVGNPLVRAGGDAQSGRVPTETPIRVPDVPPAAPPAATRRHGLDDAACLRAVRSKDARLDGWFYTAVTSTKIYCRQSCPAITPKVRNMRFYPSAAAAQQAGFRACKRCRPDAAPGSPEWHQRADLAARAMRLLGEGVVDREGFPGWPGGWATPPARSSGS